MGYGSTRFNVQSPTASATRTAFMSDMVPEWQQSKNATSSTPSGHARNRFVRSSSSQMPEL
jgi:hypothetical protein